MTSRSWSYSYLFRLPRGISTNTSMVRSLLTSDAFLHHGSGPPFWSTPGPPPDGHSGLARRVVGLLQAPGGPCQGGFGPETGAAGAIAIVGRWTRRLRGAAPVPLDRIRTRGSWPDSTTTAT